MKKPDSIIFDMDGTLWDPMDLYEKAWNNGLKEAGVEKTMSKEDLKPLMGMEGQKVLDIILPGYSHEQQQDIYKKINDQRRSLVAQGEGNIFEGVKEGLALLSKKYRLFIVSNCPEGLIRLFMKRADISESITDEMAYGVNHKPKHHNMKILTDRYDLKQPIYVGDTDGDREQSDLAGIPFVFFSFGFGKTDQYAMKFDSFKSFTDYFANL